VGIRLFGRNGVTGTSEIRELAAAGIRCQWRKSGILAGIEKVRAGFELEMLCLRPNLEIAAMQYCHYLDAGGPTELPEKDGVHDHPIDARRYFFCELGSKQGRFVLELLTQTVMGFPSKLMQQNQKIRIIDGFPDLCG
jgi:hypothetical protein